jgi:hypothetical protein
MQESKLEQTKEAIENHHVDRKHSPKLKVKMTRKEHQKLHKILPIDTLLSRKMRQYDTLTKLIVTMKNWQTSFTKDFGNSPNIGLETIEKCKQQLMKEIGNIIKIEREKTRHIKGFGPRYLAGILAYAHPTRFSSLRKFLFYCGYTEASRKLKKYNRRIKPIMHLLTTQVIMHKDTKYYSLYLKFKEQLSQRYPNKSKKPIDIMARNRLATYLLKAIYELFRAENREVLHFSQLSIEGKVYSPTSTLELHT